MHGNVREWCWDFYDKYQVWPQTDPTGPSFGINRIIRGGSYGTILITLRSAYRHFGAAQIKADDYGFRLARNAD
jgi:formylglycine-generating enzyme required for sulfatase activity